MLCRLPPQNSFHYQKEGSSDLPRNQYDSSHPLKFASRYQKEGIEEKSACYFLMGDRKHMQGYPPHEYVNTNDH